MEDGRQGRKTGRGFYTYDGAKKRVDESVYALLPGGASRRPLDEHARSRSAWCSRS